MSLKISFVIPTLNVEPIIEDCLMSIRKQDYPEEDIDIIMVDGGSIDKTHEVSKKFNVNFLNESKLRDDQEARKMIGALKSKGDLLCFIDSDNVLPNSEWLNSMVQPFKENPNLVASQPYKYKYIKELTIMNRYFALFGVNDPVAFYLNKRDRFAWYEKDWHLLGEPEDKGNYYLVEFKNSKIPTIGANGFCIRRNVIINLGVSPEDFFHIDVNCDLIEKGFNQYAFVKTDIIHNTGAKLSTFLLKRLDYMDCYYVKYYTNRRYKLFDIKKDKFKLFIYIVYSLTFIKPLIDSFRGFLVIHDHAWFLHPVLCFCITFIYAWAIMKNMFKRIIYGKN